jgi:hypothetical protein
MFTKIEHPPNVNPGEPTLSAQTASENSKDKDYDELNKLVQLRG